eukprot:11745430-Karenia_brevis.AAC.1
MLAPPPCVKTISGVRLFCRVRQAVAKLRSSTSRVSSIFTVDAWYEMQHLGMKIISAHHAHGRGAMAHQGRHRPNVTRRGVCISLPPE